jgi:hypothetical protein
VDGRQGLDALLVREVGNDQASQRLEGSGSLLGSELVNGSEETCGWVTQMRVSVADDRPLCSSSILALWVPKVASEYVNGRLSKDMMCACVCVSNGGAG